MNKPSAERTKQELDRSKGYIRTQNEYDAVATFVGSVRMAAEYGYHTILGCEELNRPVTEEELAGIQFFALIHHCDKSQMISEGHGGSVFCPCVPVFQRINEEENEEK